MEPFLKQIAADYYQQYGDSIHELCFVFPERRAGLFFKRYLSQIAGKPLLSPKTKTLKDFLLSLSAIKELDRTALLFELYRTYISILPETESFDQFLFWGGIILKDFNEIDQYLISASSLYSNLSDFKEMEDDFSFLSEKQVEAIRSFWASFSPNTKSKETDCQDFFLEFWKILAPLYTQFNKRLHEKGTGYTGMILKRIVEKLRTEKIPVREILQSSVIKGRGLPKKYVFVGLFALSPAEEYILNRMKVEGLCDFCFDNDLRILPDTHAVKKINGFGQGSLNQTKEEEPYSNNQKPKIRVIRTASEIVQAKLLPQLIKELYPEGYSDEKGINTAIILPEERMLMPVLNSLVETVGRINVTMGYPLGQSSIAILAQKWMKIHAEIRLIRGVEHFQTEIIIDLLKSLLLAPLLTKESLELIAELEAAKSFYFSTKELFRDKLTERLFAPTKDGHELLDRLFEILEMIAESIKTDEEDEFPNEIKKNHIELEQLYHYRKVLNRLIGLIDEFGLNISPQSAILLLQGLIAGTSIPFEGEPLIGVQILGFEETRVLDFDNLIILSANEGKIPNRIHQTTMIPYTLRRGHGLPLNEVNESVQGYDFFRLIEKAKNVILLYDARPNIQGAGEESRYIRQIRFLLNTPLSVEELHLTGSLPFSPEITIVKKGEVLEKLHQFLEGSKQIGEEKKKRALSASSINTYVACPLWFYFEYIQGIREENTPGELMEASDFGSVVHRAMELIYQPFCNGKEVTAHILEQWLDPQNGMIARAVQKAYVEEYLQATYAATSLSGLNHLYCVMMEKYARRIIEYDKSIAPFYYIDSERHIEGYFALSNGDKVRLHGFIDRMDEIPGQYLRIIDYKSGKADTELKKWESLFQHPTGSKNNTEQPKAIAQTLIYAMLTRMHLEKDDKKNSLHPLCPVIYGFKELYQQNNFSGEIRLKEMKETITDFEKIRESFEQELRNCLDELFDIDIPFTGTDNTKTCNYCPFASICGK